MMKAAGSGVAQCGRTRIRHSSLALVGRVGVHVVIRWVVGQNKGIRPQAGAHGLDALVDPGRELVIDHAPGNGLGTVSRYSPIGSLRLTMEFGFAMG